MYKAFGLRMYTTLWTSVLKTIKADPDLTKEERGLLDKELIYHIDDRFVDLRSELNSKQKRALEDIKQIHQKFVNNIYDQMKKAGVKEKFFDGKNFKNKDIQKVKNFV